MSAARPDNSSGGPTRSNGTRSVGIDLHRRRSRIAVIDEYGELTRSRRIVNHGETFKELLGDPDATHAALEATYGWEWLADLLQAAGYAVHLAHPLRTRAIAAARVKTDAVDTQTLAHPLRTGLLPEAYIAPPQLRDLRGAAAPPRRADQDAHRGHEPRARALARQGIREEHTDRFGQGGREFLAALELPQGSRRRLDSLISLIGDFDREITATTREIDQRAKADERVKLLCQIRGIGRYPAMLIIAEAGDGSRFPDRPAPVRLGGTGTDRAQLRRQRPPRAHLPPRLSRAALGAERNRSKDPHRRRPAARRLRADR
jgi:transposase